MRKLLHLFFDVFQNRLVYFRWRLCNAAAVAGGSREKKALVDG